MKILFSFLLSGLLASTAWAQNEVALLKAVQAKLNKVNNYVATGKMSVDVSFIKAPPSNVTIYYKKPDKVSIIKQDGLSILPKGGVSLNISSILNNSNYTTVPAGAATISGVPVTVVKLIPLSENDDVVLATLYVDEKNLVVRKAAVTTKNNGSYEMEMEYKRFVQWGLPDKVTVLFNTKEYKLPKGLTFEYEKGGSQPNASNGKNEKGKVEIAYFTYNVNKGVDEKVFKK